MGKYIIGVALAMGVAGIAFSVGAASAAIICTTGKLEIYQLEDGGRAVAWFPSRAKIPNAWGEAAKKACIAYTYIE